VTAVVRIAACSALLAAPTVLAFFSGGYFDQPRLVAAIAGWLLVVVAVLVGRPLPRSAPGWLALAGLALLTLLTLASIAWAPLAGAAQDDAQRAVLYLGYFLASLAFLRADRIIEPALATGALVVVLYGLSERVLPGLVDLDQSRTAGGRLEQPITYWNSIGAVAAMGLVLCTRLAADERRSHALRAGAAAVIAPFGAAVYLTFSRGAIAAVAAGLLVLVLLVPHRAQMRAAAVALGTGVLAAVACGVFPWVRAFAEGSLPNSVQGLLALVALLALGTAAAVLTIRWIAQPDRDAVAPATQRTRAAAAAAVLMALVLVTAAVEGSPEGDSPEAGANTARLGSLDSMRYEYWGVALGTFADNPLHGTGAGGFRVEWMREREEADTSRDAHSFYLETLAELGVLGFAALLAFLAGLVLCARRALLADRSAAIGLVALVLTFFVHAALDWDWEMPAVTLMALAAAAAVVASSELARPRARAG
jgi:uncharacterized membrane protein YhaH (DUF805 family)